MVTRWAGRTHLSACLLVAAVVSSAFAAPAVVPKREEETEHTLSWETQWVNMDRTEITRARVSISRDHLERSDGFVHAARRHKRIIYGEDDRVRIDPAREGKRFPYTSIVRVSTGCSGVMISPNHVLTAAHCVHNGDSYLQAALLFLRAGYVDANGDTQWFYAKRFFVPSEWKDKTESGEHQFSDWDDNDFAVLEMANGDLGRNRDVMKPGISGLFCNNRKSVHGADSRMEFVSFPDDKMKDAYWYVQTTVETESPHLLYFTGDATHGCSGAGLYSWDYNMQSREYEKRVIGVLSGNRDTVPFAEEQGNYNVGVRLTPKKFLMVCHWIGTEDECRDRYKQYLDQDQYDTLCRS